MHDSDIRKEIAGIREEMDRLLLRGDREAHNQIHANMQSIWGVLLQKDAGLKYLCFFSDICQKETARGEKTILNGVKSVDEIRDKHRKIRFALWRLENDLPVELCIEGLRTIDELELSGTAFQCLLSGLVVDRGKVIGKMNEIAGE